MRNWRIKINHLMPVSVSRTLCASVLFSLLLAACGGADEQKKAAAMGGKEMPPPEVDVVTVQPGTQTLTRDLPGRLQALRTAQIRARVEGIVEKRLFAEGTDVKAGTPLFQINVENYRSSNESAKANLELARENLVRAKQLLDAKMISQQSYDLTAANVKQAEAAYTKTNEDWQNTRVSAPISGRIGRAMVTEGALVGRGEATLLATIEQTDVVIANFTQTESDVARLRSAIKAGKLKHADSAKVELVLEDGSMYPLPGKLNFTDLAVDPNTGSVLMRAEFPNPQHELLPGMFVTVRMPEALVDNAISVPQRAVQANTQGQFVMVIDAENKATPQPIKTGAMVGGDFLIDSGLKGGEQIIVNGLQKAKPGTVVKAVPWQPNASAAPVAGQK